MSTTRREKIEHRYGAVLLEREVVEDERGSHRSFTRTRRNLHPRLGGTWRELGGVGILDRERKAD